MLLKILPVNWFSGLQYKTKFTTLLIFPHTFFWYYLPFYSTQLYAFMISSIITLSCLFELEETHPKVALLCTNMFLGCFGPAFLILLPNYPFLSICFHYINVVLGIRDHQQNGFIPLIVGNSGGWLFCYFYFVHYFKTHLGEATVLRSIIESDHYLGQLVIGILISYGFVHVILRQKRIQNALNNKYDSELVSLNKELEKTNQQLSCINKELQQALQEKENFILRFSHEIRNPLNSLLGNVELCHEAIKEPEAKDMLRDARVSGEILLQLLNNVLDTAKVSSGRLETSPRPHIIRKFLERAWVVCSEIIRKRKLYGCISVNLNVPEIIEFDSHRTMQILINTISNAAKFTEQGFVKVFVDFEETKEITEDLMKPRHFNSYENSLDTVEDEFKFQTMQEEISEKPKESYDYLTSSNKRFSLKRNIHLNDNKAYDEEIIFPKPLNKPQASFRSGDSQMSRPPHTKSQNKTASTREFSGFLRLEIVDSGCGIKKADLERLFQKFNQVNANSSKRQIGTGLGLWITKEIIESFQGRTKMYSLENHGTCLVIVFKCQAKSGPDTEAVVPSIQNLNSQPLAINRVLVVEDIAYNQEINRRFLEKCGVSDIVIANNGQEALNLFTQKGEQYFDLILMDIDMPIMDGKVATKLIRQHEQKNCWKASKIVFLTAYSEANTQNELMDPNGEYKANGFFPKPGSYDTIKQVLQEQSKRQPNEIAPNPKQFVLLVDDDPFNLDMMAKMLRVCGCKFLEARNGKEAVAIYEEKWRDISLILMDCEMPFMNGWEATTIINAKHEKRLAHSNKRMKVYGLTGHVSQEYKQKSIDSGMKDVLEKPITINRLRTLLVGGKIINSDSEIS